jgi:hypothetical protein
MAASIEEVEKQVSAVAKKFGFSCEYVSWNDVQRATDADGKLSCVGSKLMTSACRRRGVLTREVYVTQQEIFVWAILTREVTGSHKEIFVWAIDTCFLCRYDTRFFVSIRHVFFCVDTTCVLRLPDRRLC